MRIRSGLVVAAALVAMLFGGAGTAYAADLVVQSVNTSSFPEVEIRLALPPEMVADGTTPIFRVAENGTARAVASAIPEDGSTQGAIDVVLVLDASGSMKGAPLENAKAAAHEFVSALGFDDRIAIVTIGEQPRVVTEFTSDRAKLDLAITSVQAGGKTALYDSLVRAATMLEESAGEQRFVVLLSDGGDTVSSSSLDKSVERISEAGAPVYVVALSSPDYKPRAVKAIVRSTRGSLLSTDEASKLTEIFKAIAEEIQSTWLLTYRSADPPAPDLEIAVRARGNGVSGETVATADNPTFEKSRQEPWVALRLDPSYRVAAWAIALVLGVSVCLAVTGTALILRREGTAIDQLQYYDQLRASRVDTRGREADSDSGGVRSRLQTAISQVAGKRGFTADVAERLQRAGFQIRPNEFIYLHLLGVIGAGVVVRIATGSVPFAFLAVILATFGPLWYLSHSAQRRTQRFEADLPDIISLMAGSLRSGWGIQQAIDLIVEETREPAASEFRRVQSETRLGLSLEESLNRMAGRLQSTDFTWVVSAIGIQREVGGNLAEVLDIAAEAIRERAELKRGVKALTAEGRLSAIILVGLPFVMFGMMSLVAPRYASALTGSIYGLAMLVAALVLLLIGGVWIFNVSKVEV